MTEYQSGLPLVIVLGSLAVLVPTTAALMYYMYDKYFSLNAYLKRNWRSTEEAHTRTRNYK